MSKHLPTNRNLHIYSEDTFRGFQYYQHRGPMIMEYLEASMDVIHRSLNEHPRTLAIRVDLRYPLFYQCRPDSSVIARFTEKLRYLIAADIRERKARNLRVHPTSLRYIWCKESTEESVAHYHMMLFVNRDTYFQLGNYQSDGKGLAGMIRKAWTYALNIDEQEAMGAVHFPENPIYHLKERSSDFAATFQDVFYRASYFAKADTKFYGNRYRSFGVSQI
ncbi:inovirus Gp2 family protein [Aliidiomarina halalkaliphila]|uniref:Inovirus Gp2 family protein n=1 Tax=Aliidiomarina halalkaliphila TaxID=2593535 RepID=A0A552WZW4_9GAMM|nr:inovirus Gp2 family protein [Aliidiomarina halalkaliphila]TRW48361.1 inovirus Gp2 family protein [Aliidiomarina halalkaliphila]